MKNLILSLTTLLISGALCAQLPGSGVSNQSGVLDGVYIQEHIPTKRVYNTPSWSVYVILYVDENYCVSRVFTWCA